MTGRTFGSTIIPLLTVSPITSLEKGPHAISAIPESLCHFQRENVLAMEVSDKAVSVKSEDDSVGIAYILQMVFSDGRQMLLTSDDAADHRCRYIPDRMAGEPREWHQNVL